MMLLIFLSLPCAILSLTDSRDFAGALCEPGKWGVDCKTSCGHCNGTSACNNEDGTCVYGCLSGYKVSLHCLSECDPGQWGPNCSNACGQCFNGQICDKMNGKCRNPTVSGVTNTLPSGCFLLLASLMRTIISAF